VTEQGTIAVATVRTFAVHQNWRRVRLVACGLAVLAATTATAAIAASGATTQPELVAFARALIVGLPMAVGLYAWSRSPTQRFGMLLVATSAAWSFTTLAESGDDLSYTLGRSAGWVVEVLVVYLILAFPSGRLLERTDRVLVGAMAAVVVTLFLPRLALAEGFELPSPFTSCRVDCPQNAFLLFDPEPAFVEAVMRPAGALLVVAVMVAVLLRLRERIRDATALARHVLTPVLAVGIAHVALLGVGFSVRQADPTTWPAEVAAWSLAFVMPAIALAWLVGIVRWQLFAGRTLQRLAERISATSDPAALRRALGQAFGDPTIQIVFPAPNGTGGWVDPLGHPVTLPERGSGHGRTEISDRGTVLAAVIHDDALDADPRLIDAATSIAGVALRNQQLAVEASTATRDVRRSRARIAATAERERRRIERDLHDGAQQRLVALRIELELAEELVRRDPKRGADRLHVLEQEVDWALEELRELAHGVYPPLLADQGLVEALLAVARRSPVRVEIEAHGVERYPPEIESAVYFCVLEALQNVAKHAGAHRAVVRLDGGVHSELALSVRDDGGAPGERTIVPGAGITNMRDRLAAVGGELEVSSTIGVGTTVRGRVPTQTQIST
jgi:signal transduction histidine kinase